MREIRQMGHKIYDLDNPREKRRYVIFCARAFLHSRGLKELYNWFQSDPLRCQLIEANPYPIEQATRAFFYKGSTFATRSKLVREHFAFLQSRVTEEHFLNLGDVHKQGFCVWQGDFEGQALQAVLCTEAGQRKEGLLSLELNLGQEHIYQIMFWFAKDDEGRDSLYIGALQGPNMEEARDLIKRMTKAFHGYRTKNLILYMLQAVARGMGVERMYGVTNEGYYAMNHVRANRKLKTSFSDFWLEAGGEKTEDARFDSLPLTETRKTMEEVPTRKRAVYRKRFALLDEIDEKIGENMEILLGKIG